MRKWLLFIFVIGGIQSQLFAQDTIFTDRPTVTFSPRTMPKGWFQIETGFSYQISTVDPGGQFLPGVKSEDILYNSTLFRYALTNSLEVRLTQDLSQNQLKQDGEKINSTSTSFSSPRVGIKYNFVHFKQGGQRVSLLANYAPPIFSSDSEDYFEMLLLFHSPVFKNFSFDYNIGWDFSDGFNSSNFKYSILLSKSFSRRLSGYVEVFGVVPDEGSSQFNYDLGLMYLINNTIQVDIYGGSGFSDFSPDFIFGFGLSKLFLPHK